MNGLELMDRAIEEHKPVAVYALFSGGHDSLTATHIAAQHPAFKAAVHINTGIGIAETREFVRDTCRDQKWPLIEFRAKEDCGQDYRQLVIEHGFPGPYAHRKMYARLKERAIRKLVRETKTHLKDRVMLVTGSRSQESKRRMRHVEPLHREDARVWVAVIHDWSKIACNEYIDSHELKRNRVVDLIHMSGECLCGAFAHPGELKEIECWFPETAAEIRQLEKEVVAAGHCWGWEEKPPHTKQRRLVNESQMQLCFSCIHNPAQTTD